MSLYLIAILPPEEISLKVTAWKEYMLDRFNCRVALKSPAHITLIPPFTFPDKEKQSLELALDTFAKEQQPFSIGLKNFDTFAARVIYVHITENKILSDFKDKLEYFLLENGYPIKKEERVYHPHITITNRDLTKHDFPIAWEYFKKLRYEAFFDARSLTLLKHNGKTWDRAYDALLP